MCENVNELNFIQEQESCENDKPESREEIKEELLEMAKRYLNSFEEHEIVMEDPERNYVARQTFDNNGIAVTIIK